MFKSCIMNQDSGGSVGRKGPYGLKGIFKRS